MLCQRDRTNCQSKRAKGRTQLGTEAVRAPISRSPVPTVIWHNAIFALAMTKPSADHRLRRRFPTQPAILRRSTQRGRHKGAVPRGHRELRRFDSHSRFDFTIGDLKKRKALPEAPDPAVSIYIILELRS